MYHQQRSDSNVSNSSDFFSKKEQRTPVRKLVTPTSSLEIVDGDKDSASGFYDDRSSPASMRSWSRTSTGSIPPRSDSSISRRTVTPTKQVSLQAVRRKEESSEPFVDHIKAGNSRTEECRRKAWEFEPADDDIDFSNMSVGDNRRSNPHKPDLVHPSPQTNKGQKQSLSEPPAQNHKKHIIDNKDRPSSSSGEDDEEDEDKDENEKQKAPTELLMEFIDCLMKKDFPNASKLCKMILLYEPENEEALKFQPLIEEKMALDVAAAAEEDEEGSEDEDDDDDDNDDSDDSSDDDDDDDDDSSDESDDDDDDDDDDNIGNDKPSTLKPTLQDDSGIVGANTKRVWKPAN